jgi:outer membrane biosynthesis protein TonB
MYKRVTSIVISFHLLLIMFLLFSPHPTPIKKKNHVVVRTVRPTTPIKKAPQTKAKPSQPQKAAPQKKPAAPAAVKPKPQAAAKKQTTSNKPAIIEKGKPVKKALPKKTEPSEKMWNEIDQALAKIEKKSYPASKQTLEIPKPLIFLDEHSSEEVHIGDDSEMARVMGFLSSSLTLPIAEEIKMKITVRKDGTITNVVILQSASKKNKEYMQKNLPNLQLPMQFDQEQTWTIVFCNEI